MFPAPVNLTSPQLHTLPPLALPHPQDPAQQHAKPTPFIRSVPVAASSRIEWPTNDSAIPYSTSIIVDGEFPFDRKTLEASGRLPATPHSILYCSELPGASHVERGLALLAEIRRRKAGGEFSAFTPTLLFLHGTVHNGELLLGDSQGRIRVPAQVLLHELSTELDTAGALAAAPVVLSGCEAGGAAEALKNFRRPVLINGCEETLLVDDAEAMFDASVRLAEGNWLLGQRPDPVPWFEKLGSVTADTLHLVGHGEWTIHDLMSSATSLGSASPQQAGLLLRKMILRGSVNDFAEALQLFGTDALHAHPEWTPTMHFILDADAPAMLAKIVLLCALGVSVDQNDAKGRTLLHRVCSIATGQACRRDPKMLVDVTRLARMLLANGANPDAKDDDGVTPRALAAQGGHPNLIAAFKSDLAGRDLPTLGPAGLRIAAEKHRWTCVISLLDDPLQVMDVDDEGMDSSRSEMPVDETPSAIQSASKAGIHEAEYIAAAAIVSLGDYPMY